MKILQKYLACCWRINNIATCCSKQHDSYYVTIKLKNNGLWNIKVILVSFFSLVDTANCESSGEIMKVYGNFCGVLEGYVSSMSLFNGWIIAPKPNFYMKSRDPLYAKRSSYWWLSRNPCFLTANVFAAGKSWTTLPYRPDLLPSDFHFLGPHKE